VGAQTLSGSSAAGSAHTHTLSWPAGVPTNASGSVDAHAVTNNAVTSAAGSAHTHTLSWPAGVPTNTSGAVDAHGVTNNAVTSGNPSATLSHSVTQPTDHTLAGSSAAVSAGTPSGTVSQPTFSGASGSTVNAHLKVIFCAKD